MAKIGKGLEGAAGLARPLLASPLRPAAASIIESYGVRTIAAVAITHFSLSKNNKKRVQS